MYWHQCHSSCVNSGVGFKMIHESTNAILAMPIVLLVFNEVDTFVNHFKANNIIGTAGMALVPIQHMDSPAANWSSSLLTPE